MKRVRLGVREGQCACAFTCDRGSRRLAHRREACVPALEGAALRPIQRASERAHLRAAKGRSLGRRCPRRGARGCIRKVNTSGRTVHSRALTCLSSERAARRARANLVRASCPPLSRAHVPPSRSSAKRRGVRRAQLCRSACRQEGGKEIYAFEARAPRLVRGRRASHAALLGGQSERLSPFLVRAANAKLGRGQSHARGERARCAVSIPRTKLSDYLGGRAAASPALANCQALRSRSETFSAVWAPSDALAAVRTRARESAVGGISEPAQTSSSSLSEVSLAAVERLGQLARKPHAASADHARPPPHVPPLDEGFEPRRRRVAKSLCGCERGSSSRSCLLGERSATATSFPAERWRRTRRVALCTERARRPRWRAARSPRGGETREASCGAQRTIMSGRRRQRSAKQLAVVVADARTAFGPRSAAGASECESGVSRCSASRSAMGDGELTPRASRASSVSSQRGPRTPSARSPGCKRRIGDSALRRAACGGRVPSVRKWLARRLPPAAAASPRCEK